VQSVACEMAFGPLSSYLQRRSLPLGLLSDSVFPNAFCFCCNVEVGGR